MINKKLNILLIISSLTILMFIGIITVKLILKTDTPLFLDIDFEKKSDIISSYGTLIGALLSFLSIIFIIYTIIQQKSQYENDKLIESEKEKNALFDRLKLVHNLLNEILKHISDTGEEMENFFKKEIENPLTSNLMSFYTNRNYYRLLELDYQSIYSAFQEFSIDADKTDSFNNLYKSVDFYSESIIEQMEKFQYHIKDKFERKQKVVYELSSIMDDASEIIEEYKVEFSDNENYKQNKWYNLLNGLIAFYHERIPVNDEIDLEIIEKEVLFTFLKDADIVRKEIGFEKDTLKLVLKIAGIRKQLYSLKMESQHFGEQMKKRYQNYYSSESNSLIKLNQLRDKIETLIKSSN